MTVTINGVEYPIAYTVEAQSEVSERAGGLERIKDMIGSEKLSNTAMLHIMMVAADRRNRVLAKMAGEEYSGPVIPEEDELNDLILMGEMKQIITALGDAMREGGKTEVEIKPEKAGKKTGAIQSK